MFMSKRLFAVVMFASFAFSSVMAADEDGEAGCVACGTRRASSRTSASMSVGSNVNVSKLSGYQAETAIAINPTDTQKLVIFSNSSTTGLFRSYSTNGGQTWTAGNIATGADNLEAACCDPTVCFDKFGTLFLCYLTNAAKPGTIVYSSTDSGVTFTKVATLSTDSDQPTIVSGPGSTAGSSTVWVLYTDTNGNQVAQGMATTALGTFGSFGSVITVPNTNGLGFGDIAIGPAGQVVVGFQNTGSGNGPDTIKCSVNTVGLGGTFSNLVTLSATNVGGFDNITPQPNRSIDSELGLAIDTTNGPFRGRTYAVYTDESPDESNDTNIMFRYSDNFGSTWSSAVRINDDATTRSQFFPKIALDPTTGAVAIAWMDCRNDSGSGQNDRDSAANTDAQVYAAVTTDGGVTFATNVRISAGSTNAKLQSDTGNEFGDYIGIAYHGGKFYPAWPDNSNSTGDNPDGTSEFDIYTAKVTVTINNGGPLTTTTTASNAAAPFSSSAQNVTLNATVTASNTVNEGTVTFQIKSGNTNVGTAVTSSTVSTGAASVTYALPANLAQGTYTIVATYNATANFLTSSDSTHTLTISNAPIFTSAANATPNPATINQSVQFSAAASGASTITFTWNFGDGSSGSGASPTHTYTSASTFTATVTATDLSNQTATSSVQVTVNASNTGIGVLPGEIDTDGDGYSDTIEIADGSNPNDPTDNPGFGDAPVLRQLTQTKFTISRTGKLTMTGTLAIPADFDPGFVDTIVDIAGYTQVFFLSSRGSGRTGRDSFRVTFKIVRGTVAAQTAKFTLSLNAVTNQVVDGAPLQIVIGNLVFRK